MLQAILTTARGSPRAELSVTLILLDALDTSVVALTLPSLAGAVLKTVLPPWPQGVGPTTKEWEGLFSKPALSESDVKTPSASSRINVTDNSALGLPRAVVRMACSKGTYVRAFARDLGEVLGSGAHLDSLQRSGSGIFRVENALTVEQAIDVLQK